MEKEWIKSVAKIKKSFILKSLQSIFQNAFILFCQEYHGLKMNPSQGIFQQSDPFDLRC